MAASGLYGQTRVAAGIVGYADLSTGSQVKAVLEAEMAAAPNRFRGIRCTGAWDPDPLIARAEKPGLYLDKQFREGLAQLAPLGLSFDLACRYHQLPECVDLARSFPDTTIILNHVGGITGIGAYAGRREEVFAQWRASIAELAQCPNVVVKLGGLAMEYCGFGWHERCVPPSSEELAQAMRAYFESVIESFGPQRCMFESNFPVDKVSCSYNVLWNAFKRITGVAVPRHRGAHLSVAVTVRLKMCVSTCAYQHVWQQA
jgi:predicted TIM-barrel fold metal-dependent hydrolase